MTIVMTGGGVEWNPFRVSFGVYCTGVGEIGMIWRVYYMFYKIDIGNCLFYNESRFHYKKLISK